MNELVLDISKYDPDIDLAAWKAKHNLWGVIIKAGGNETGLGRYRDSWCERHYQNAKAAGLHVGFYYYTVSTDISNAVNDADHFYGLIMNYKWDLPCYMDVEDPRQFNLSRRALTDVIKAFCDRLISHGCYAGMYTGGSAWLNNMYPDELRDYANWIAWWRRTWPSEAGDIGMWQQGGMRYSDGMIVYDDISGFHDVDWCVVDYPSRINGGQKKYEPNQNGSGGTVDDVIRIAEGELGYYAPNDPERGSKYGRWMAQITGEDWMAGPSVEIWWCCMFVSWVLNKAGVVVKGFPSQNTDLALKNGARNYLVDKNQVRRGDILIFDWNWSTDSTDHIGFATGSASGGYVPTLEGNVSNSVMRKTRALSTIRYCIRPHYATAPAPAPQPTPTPAPEPEPEPVLPDGYSTKLYQTNNTPMQHYKFIAEDDGYYRILNVGRDMYLDVRESLKDDHTPVRVWKRLESDGQLWRLVPVSSEFGTYFELEPKCAPGMRLDAINGGTTNKTGLWIHPDNDTDAQRWSLIKSSDGVVRIISVKSGLAIDAGAGVQP